LINKLNYLGSASIFIQQLPPESKIFITGATGLIGFNLVRILLAEIDLNERSDILIYANTRRPETNLWFDHSNLRLVNLNLLSLSTELKFSVVFHLATYGQPGRFTVEPLETMRLNSQAIFNLEKTLTDQGIFYFASSSEVYSGNPNVPHNESECGFTNTTHARSMYIEAKRFGEAYCYWNSKAGYRYHSGRIALCYGPGPSLVDERVLNQLIVRGIRNQEIRLLDDGSAMRQYCYVEDTLDIIFRQINANHFSPINVSGSTIISIKDLGEEIASQLGVPIYLGPSTGSISGAPLVVSSSQDLVGSLGKNDFVPLSVGIESTISWYKRLMT